jgi:hypothetical protein
MLASLATVNAPIFPPHRNFPYFLGRSVALQVDSVIKINETNSADLIDFSTFHSLHFSVGHVLMLANAFKREVESSYQVESYGLLRYVIVSTSLRNLLAKCHI